MEHENIKKSLKPIVNNNSKILILGSLPSDKSIKGSFDSDIKKGEFNDIKDLLNKFPNLKTILVNGKKSEMAFKQYLKYNKIVCDYKYVPSSSSANTKYSLLEKIEYWKKAMFE